jgi:hypothetical protein
MTRVPKNVPQVGGTKEIISDGERSKKDCDGFGGQLRIFWDSLGLLEIDDKGASISGSPKTPGIRAATNP